MCTGVGTHKLRATAVNSISRSLLITLHCRFPRVCEAQFSSSAGHLDSLLMPAGKLPLSPGASPDTSPHPCLPFTEMPLQVSPGVGCLFFWEVLCQPAPSTPALSLRSQSKGFQWTEPERNSPFFLGVGGVGREPHFWRFSDYPLAIPHTAARGQAATAEKPGL